MDRLATSSTSASEELVLDCHWTVLDYKYSGLSEPKHQSTHFKRSSNNQQTKKPQLKMKFLICFALFVAVAQAHVVAPVTTYAAAAPALTYAAAAPVTTYAAAAYPRAYSAYAPSVYSASYVAPSVYSSFASPLTTYAAAPVVSLLKK
ncbi:pupal cuticle protein C1B isoform X2 [Drosophila willistoni]|uniref:pupal cuticle protein C1B isoform X2 n=1 Tax=Drosophila willistoni TaxID=7260 RepID=UPI001F072353|nr:pupal cuticle protein C1B isoform X2 [Drosophila willistoni]